MLSNSRDLQCARLADKCDIPAIAEELRQISRELILKAQREARLQSSAA